MKYKFTLLLLLGVVSSCSSLSSLNFLSDDSVEDISVPAELLKFKEDVVVSIAWKKSFKASNDLGSFKPSFYAGQMLVADSDGEITSLDPKTGSANWIIKLERTLSAGVVAGFGKFVVSDVDGYVIGLDLDS